MANKPGQELVSGATEVATAQTPVQLAKSDIEVAEGKALLGVWVTLAASATGAIAAIGGSKAGTEAKKELGKEKGIIIEKKMVPFFIEVDRLSAVWADVEKSKDIITWTAVVA